MTPLEQTFWCERFQWWIGHAVAIEDTPPGFDAHDMAARNADLDLEEFRKRFGGGEAKADKLDTAIDLLDRNNQTPATTLYPWELLPEWVVACAKDATGFIYAYEYVPVASEESQSWGYDDKDHNSTGTKYASFDELEVIWSVSTDWRLSLEKRPGGGEKS